MREESKKGQADVNGEPLGRLFRGGELYCPDYRGRGDLLVVGGIIVRVAQKIDLEKNCLDLEIIDATDRILTPGLIDQHVHIIGAGGSSGPVTRTREIRIQDVVQAGVTTLVGTLGFDIITRDLKRLLVKAQALEAQGVTTFIYTGSYTVPAITLTGSMESDLLLIDKVVGIKLAVAEPLSTRPDENELMDVIVGGHRGGLLSGKAGIVHVHVGGAPGAWFKMTEKILHETMIPFTQIVFTHCNRSSGVFKDAFEFAKIGGMVDMTAALNLELLSPEENKSLGLKKPSKAIEEMLELGISEDSLTLSSDSNASAFFHGKLVFSYISDLYKEFRDLARDRKNIPLALKMVTLNPAKRLKIASKKGSLDAGKDADVLVLSRDLDIQEVYARGKQMVKNGEAVVKDPFE